LPGGQSFREADLNESWFNERPGDYAVVDEDREGEGRFRELILKIVRAPPAPLQALIFAIYYN
jgi:hypothetical protein